MKVVIYSRTSTKKQNIKEQLLSLVDICNKNEWEIVRYFKDESFSGLELEREGLLELIDFVKNNKVDKLVVSEISRLSRDKEQLKELITLLSDLKISLYISDLKLDTLIDNKINVNSLTIIYSEIDYANREISKIRSRLNRGYTSHIKNGGDVGRKKGFRNTDAEILLKHEDVVNCLMKGFSIRTTMLLCKKSNGLVLKVRKILNKNNSIKDVIRVKPHELLKKIIDSPDWKFFNIP
jgi:DNA invertase Pin-like site-specific DNA recombinase